MATTVNVTLASANTVCGRGPTAIPGGKVLLAAMAIPMFDCFEPPFCQPLEIGDHEKPLEPVVGKYSRIPAVPDVPNKPVPKTTP